MSQSLIDAAPFAQPAAERTHNLLEALRELTAHHELQCAAYARITSALPRTTKGSLSEIPYLPVALFKLMKLASIPDSEVIRVLTSSGTTGQAPSRIYLDRDTAAVQLKALTKIAATLLGRQRLPMLVVDTRAVLEEPLRNSARAAGILGFSTLGRDHVYLLDREMRPDWDNLKQFLAAHTGQKIFVMGFTFMIWKYFVLEARRAGISLNFGDAILIHGGGWKKLASDQVTASDFAASLQQQFGIATVRSYYGMVEQVGSIFLECSAGHLHAPAYADVIVRDQHTLKPCSPGVTGLVQVLSALPRSYPGHSLLTEDLGTVFGRDDCSCGQTGTHFTIHGRIPSAPLRGCSDTHAVNERTIA